MSDTVRRALAKLGRELEHFTKSGIVEVAVRNPSVADYMRHWEGRTETAEAKLKVAEEALRASHTVLLALTDPKVIPQTTVINVYAQAVEAELKVRRALAEKGE